MATTAILYHLLPLYLVFSPTIGYIAHKERVEDGFLSNHYTKEGEHNDDFDHQAILGSKDTAKQFDSLSADESKRRLRLLVVNGMDANRDSFVDKHELIEWIMKSFYALTVEEGRERLEEEDSNRDGLVSWSEHLSDTFDLDDTEENNILQDEIMAEDWALWLAADLDGDGLLNVTEFTAFNSPEEYEHMHDILFKQMMAKRDKNGDGFIDLLEFAGDANGIPPDPQTEHFIAEKERFNSVYDIDKDGRLNKQECLLWLIPDNREIAETEANHLISTSDDNSDGKLSVDEIVDHHDVFVGSDATDFGSQLENSRFIDEL
jgi:Ca2+-binding EF-hand superfamily protein